MPTYNKYTNRSRSLTREWTANKLLCRRLPCYKQIQMRPRTHSHTNVCISLGKRCWLVQKRIVQTTRSVFRVTSKRTERQLSISFYSLRFVVIKCKYCCFQFKVISSACCKRWKRIFLKIKNKNSEDKNYRKKNRLTLKMTKTIVVCSINTVINPYVHLPLYLPIN